jgi:hypothetical protein
VGSCCGGQPTGRRSVHGDGIGVPGLEGVVGQPRRIGVSVREACQDRLVEPHAAMCRQRRFHGQPRQLVSKPHAIGSRSKQARRERPVPARRRLRQPRLRTSGNDRDELQQRTRLRRQRLHARHHGLPDGGGHRPLGTGEHLGQEEGIPTREAVELLGRPARCRGQPGDGRRAQRLERHVCHVSRRGVTEHAADRSGGPVVVAVGDQDQPRDGLQAPPEPDQEVEARLVRPVHVLDHQHPGRLRTEGVEDRIEDDLARSVLGEESGEPTAGVPGGVTDRSQGPRRVQRIAGAPQDDRRRHTLAEEPRDHRRLADAGLA